jgi:hypothetical protein
MFISRGMIVYRLAPHIFKNRQESNINNMCCVVPRIIKLSKLFNGILRKFLELRSTRRLVVIVVFR